MTVTELPVTQQTYPPTTGDLPFADTPCHNIHNGNAARSRLLEAG